MRTSLSRQFIREYSGLTVAAITLAVSCGILLQLFDTPGSVVLFAFSAGTVFGVFGGGFRRESAVLEFLLTRNISRGEYYLSRWVVGVIPLTLSVILVSVNMFLPISSWFWSLFVESGFTFQSDTLATEGLGWFLFAVFGALWSYSATFAMVSRTKSISSLFVALLTSIIIMVAVILLYMASASALCSLGIVSTIGLYEPDSGVWISFYVFSSILCAVSLLTGIRYFNRVDVL